MFLQVIVFTGAAVHRLALDRLVVARASLSIPDTLFLFVVALVVFGPKRLPEIGKQIGKLVFEFRRASNDFKLQIEEELRVADQQDKQKQAQMLAAATASTPAVAAAQRAALSSGEPPVETDPPPPPDRTIAHADAPALTIQPPSSGAPVSALPPNHTAVSATPETPATPPSEEVTAPLASEHHGE